ncbi:MAG: hypothetical protein ACQES8_01290 [Thermodesulfobacteriota bacterium]
MGSVYMLEGNRSGITAQSRGIKIQSREGKTDVDEAAEFYETSLNIHTRP